ncbi:hypothetical protein [Lysinibacillus sp. FSL W8-0992]|uniref:hypothetical protein n=1 Tax=Lysinibacillus sp. FSL W8-0992 TaxID=2954643 RepID=UPI0030FAA453
MSEIEEQKLEAGLEQIVRHFMKDQLSNVTDFRKEGDNSFAFLEKSTLHLLLSYLLSGDKRAPEENITGQFELHLIKELDDLIADNKVQFEEIIDYLKS